MTTLLRKVKLDFSLQYVENCNYGGIRYAHICIDNILNLYDFTILNDKIELRIYDKNFDYGGFGYEEVSKIFYSSRDLQGFLEETISDNFITAKN